MSAIFSVVVPSLIAMDVILIVSQMLRLRKSRRLWASVASHL